MPSVRRRGRPWRRAGLVVAVATLLVVGAGSALQGTLVYYRTPDEVADARVQPGQDVRISGVVQPGSLERLDDGVRFVLEGSDRDLVVTSDDIAPATLREGEDAVVEGRLTPAGGFVADTVLVRHSNEYGSK